MDRSDAPVALGLASSVLVVALVLLPYALPSVEYGGVSTYYDYGLLGAWSVLVVAVVAVVVYAAALADRSDPPLAAGAGLTLGLAAVVLAGYWVVQLPYHVVAQLSTDVLFGYHRWAVLVLAVGIALGGFLSATEQDLF